MYFFHEKHKNAFLKKSFWSHFGLFPFLVLNFHKARFFGKHKPKHKGKRSVWRICQTGPKFIDLRKVILIFSIFCKDFDCSIFTRILTFSQSAFFGKHKPKHKGKRSVWRICKTRPKFIDLRKVKRDACLCLLRVTVDFFGFYKDWCNIRLILSVDSIGFLMEFLESNGFLMDF